MQAQIEHFVAGGPQMATSIAGLSSEQLTAFPVPGTWSIQQIVLHMLDSDLIACERMKRVIAEEKPLLIGYDETAFGERLFYHDLDPHLACQIYADNRRMMGEILRRLGAADFLRVGIHNEKGAVTLGQFVELYIQHWDHHHQFIVKKRALLTKP